MYVLGGHPVADVVDRWGGVYRAVRFLGLGGGAGNFASAGAVGVESDDKSTLATDGNAAEVALVFPEVTKRSRAQKPWIIASAMHPSDGAKVTVETAAPDAGADYDKHHVADHVVQRGDGRVVVSPLAGVLLDGLPGQPVRIQLAGTDKLRLSSDGEADETILLGGKLRAYLNGLAAQLEAVRGALVRLENWGSSVAFEPAAASYSLWVDPEFEELAPTEPFAGTADTIQSGVVAISSKSLADVED
jgi:hypothetical protein